MGTDAALVVWVKPSVGESITMAKNISLNLMPQIGSEYVGGTFREKTWPMLVTDVQWSVAPDWAVVKLTPTDDMVEEIEYLDREEIFISFEESGWYEVRNESVMVDKMKDMVEERSL